MFFKILKKAISIIQFRNPFISSLILTIIIIALSEAPHVFADKKMPNGDDFPTHLNFLKGRRRHRRVIWCGDDAGVCSDPGKNPWGGSTCCFQRYCKDVRNDPNHCGLCGRVCGFGRACCGGECVDTRNDPLHCGACYEVCTGGDNACSYSMCDYGG